MTSHHHDHQPETTPSHNRHTHDQYWGHQHHHDDHHAHPHDHNHTTWWGKLQHAIPFLHSHSHVGTADRALESSTRGLWALKMSLLGLGITALLQIIVFTISGSVGLLADTIHNASDALTAIPLGIAFVLSRRAANRRYTYGYGRAEDLAGVIIVLMILASSLVAGYESIMKFVHPEPLRNVWWVIIAAFIGFFGNEAVAVFRIRVGREIGSAALVADGQHARIDGLTSLAVLFGAVGSMLGFPLADPIIGLLITLAILLIVKETALVMWHRLMDAVDPTMTENLQEAAAHVADVHNVHDLRLRWIGHKLHAELHITVDEDLPTRESHRIGEAVRHALFHAQPGLATITVHVDPCGHGGEDAHATFAHPHVLPAS